MYTYMYLEKITLTRLPHPLSGLNRLSMSLYRDILVRLFSILNTQNLMKTNDRNIVFCL